MFPSPVSRDGDKKSKTIIVQSNTHIVQLCFSKLYSNSKQLYFNCRLHDCIFSRVHVETWPKENNSRKFGWVVGLSLRGRCWNILWGVNLGIYIHVLWAENRFCCCGGEWFGCRTADLARAWLTCKQTLMPCWMGMYFLVGNGSLRSSLLDVKVKLLRSLFWGSKVKSKASDFGKNI